MASATSFFAPEDILSINTLLTLADDLVWIIQSNKRSKKADRASGLKANGDENKWKSHNASETRTLVYECQADSGTLKVPVVGTVTATTLWHIDSVKVDYKPNGWPTLTVQVHKHTGASTHAAASCHTYTAAIALPAQFGCPVLINNLATPTPGVEFELEVATIGIKSVSYGLSCTHQDETGSTGDWLAGENRDGVETLDVDFTGIPEDADVTIGATWHEGSGDEDLSNSSVSGNKRSFTRHVARTA